MTGKPIDTWSYRAAFALLRVLLRAFFKRVEVDGLDNVPTDRGVLLVAWHPNGLIDPALILAQLPGRVVFGARHGLLLTPILGQVMAALGTVPIYRASDTEGDPESRRAANRKSLDALAAKIATGACSALFPEGVSHDEPHLMELKTGAARLYYRARQLGASGGGSRKPAIVPVGLHYDRKHLFRSRALVRFHEPLELPADLDVTPGDDEPDERFRERARELTGVIEAGLIAAVHPTESWKVHQLFHRGRKAIRAERASRAGVDPGRPGMLEKQLGFSRIWIGYEERRRTHPDEVATLMHRIGEYDADLRALGLEDHELDRAPRLGSALLPLILIAQVVMVYVLLPPLLVIGIVVNLPAALAVVAIAKHLAGARKDEASLKIIIGAFVFPIAWVVTAVLLAFGYVQLEGAFPSVPDTPILAGIFIAALGVAGGVVATRYRRLSAETVRSLRVRFTRRRRAAQIQRLLVERAALHDLAVGLGEGVELPGRVGRDGRIVPA